LKEMWRGRAEQESRILEQLFAFIGGGKHTVAIDDKAVYLLTRPVMGAWKHVAIIAKGNVYDSWVRGAVPYEDENDF